MCVGSLSTIRWCAWWVLRILTNKFDGSIPRSWASCQSHSGPTVSWPSYPNATPAPLPLPCPLPAVHQLCPPLYSCRFSCTPHPALPSLSGAPTGTPWLSRTLCLWRPALPCFCPALFSHPASFLCPALPSSRDLSLNQLSGSGPLQPGQTWGDSSGAVSVTPSALPAPHIHTPLPPSSSPFPFAPLQGEPLPLFCPAYHTHGWPFQKKKSFLAPWGGSDICCSSQVCLCGVPCAPPFPRRPGRHLQYNVLTGSIPGTLGDSPALQDL